MTKRAKDQLEVSKGMLSHRQTEMVSIIEPMQTNGMRRAVVIVMSEANNTQPLERLHP